MMGAREFLVGCFLQALRPASGLGLVEWMEKHIVLQKTESLDSPGEYRRDRSIPMGRLFELFNADPEWERLWVKKGSQSAFTLHCLGDITRTVAEDPQNMVFVIDSADEAKKISRKRLQPMLKDCEATAGMWREYEAEQKLLELTFPGMSLWLAGSNSAGPVANKSAGRNYADEVDKHGEPEGEADVVDLLEQRGKEVEGAVLIGGSTPTTEVGTITVKHKTGSQHRYYVPCPACEEMQVLEMKGLIFRHCKRETGSYDLRRVLKETYYRCERCAAEIREEEKPTMLERGEWRATNYEEQDGDLVPAWEPGVMSAHLSDLYSVHKNSTWGRLAVEWIKALNDPKAMHNFRNSRLGLEVKATVVEVKQDAVRRLACGYRRGSLPEVPCILTLQADNQGDKVVKWVISGWRADGTQMVADWGQVDAREKLDDIVKQRGIACPGERTVYVQRAIIDEGGEEGTTWEVRLFCAKRWPMFTPAKGRSGRQINDLAKFAPSSIAKGGLEKIPVMHFDDDAFKRLLYLQRIARFDERKVREEGLSRLMLPVNVSDQFCRELSGENLRRVPGKGVMWVPSPPNDFGDCVKMGEVLWNVIGGEFQGR